MSFLTFLLFSSFVYFAIADPIAATKDQDNVDEFMAAVEKLYDEHITPLMESHQSNKQDLDYFKTTTLNGMAGVLNLSLYYATTSKDADFKTALDHEDIILQFDSTDTFPSAPFQDSSPLCTKT